MERYYVVIALTFIGFVALAAILLVPVYLFLKKEEEVASHWTDETVAKISDSSQASNDRSGGKDNEIAAADEAGSRSGGA